MIVGPASRMAQPTAPRFGVLVAAALVLALPACSEAPADAAPKPAATQVAKPNLKAAESCIPLGKDSNCCITSRGTTSCASVVSDDDASTKQPAATATEPATTTEQDRAE